jgi:hypothetical protein
MPGPGMLRPPCRHQCEPDATILYFKIGLNRS